jgi:hypothetical protein
MAPNDEEQSAMIDILQKSNKEHQNIAPREGTSNAACTMPKVVKSI